MAENTLFYGDNLDVLRRYVKDETVDFIYLDSIPIQGISITFVTSAPRFSRATQLRNS